MLVNGPIGFKLGLQNLPAQSTMKAELVAVVLATKEAVFCSNIMVKLGLMKGFNSLPLYPHNTSKLHVTSNRT